MVRETIKETPAPGTSLSCTNTRIQDRNRGRNRNRDSKSCPACGPRHRGCVPVDADALADFDPNRAKLGTIVGMNLDPDHSLRGKQQKLLRP